MKFIKYGVTLSRLKEEEIEMVRRWRNDPVVVANYAFRDHITPEMQRQWFRSINNKNNLYLIIHYRGQTVGVINLKNINWEEQTAESGIFIPYKEYHETPVSAIVSFLTTEFLFKLFNWKAVHAHVLKGNQPVQAFVRQLGYELSPGQEEVENQEYSLSREKFEKLAPRIKKAIHTLAGDQSAGKCIIEPCDDQDELVIFLEELAKKNMRTLKTEITEEGRVYFFD